MSSHTGSVARFDCTDGGALFCRGCYTMEQHELGDYVRFEDYEHLRQQLALVTKLARIYYGEQHPQEHAVLTRAEALADELVSGEPK